MNVSGGDTWELKDERGKMLKVKSFARMRSGNACSYFPGANQVAGNIVIRCQKTSDRSNL